MAKGKRKKRQNIHKTKDRVARTPQEIGCEFGCTGWVSSSCSTSGTWHINL